MAVMREHREGRQALTKTVGRGSNWQVDDFDFRMSSDISATGGSLKRESEQERGGEKTEKDEL